MPQLGRIIQFCLMVIQGHFLFKKIFPVASQVVEWTLISGKKSHFKKTIVDFPGGPVIKNPPAIQETRVQSLEWEDPTCYLATKPATTEAWTL